MFEMNTFETRLANENLNSFALLIFHLDLTNRNQLSVGLELEGSCRGVHITTLTL